MSLTLSKLPLITIITVVYNGVEYIEETIRSVLDQTYPNLNYIIIDGGSIDGTVDIIKKYENKITCWISEKDRGIYDAMNKGIKLTSIGSLMIFLNAGDKFVGNVLSERITKPCFLPVKYLDRKGRLVDFKIRNYKLGIPNCHQGIVFRNDGIIYDLTYKVCADYDFFLKQKDIDDFKLVKTDGYVYYDSSGYSSKNSELRIKERALIAKKFFGNFYYWQILIRAKINNFLEGV